VERGGHSLKGAAASLAAEPLREAAYQLEMTGRSGDFGNAAALLDQLKVELKRVEEFVQNLDES